MADTNPGNFANRPTEEVREIAAKGGHASHGDGATQEAHTDDGRHADGTFVKGSEAAKEAGHKGGLVASGQLEEPKEPHPPGRNADGTFYKGSDVAKEVSHKGGVTQ